MQKNIILNKEKITHITRRIAYQIFETFSDETEIIIAGISGNGFIFAQRISEIFREISDIKIKICELKIDKTNPHNHIISSLESNQYKDKAVVLVDDVLSSGTTLIYGVKFFLDTPIKKLKTAVLVDRNHKKFPIKADFKGLSLSTSLMERIEVVFDKNNDDYAFLS